MHKAKLLIIHCIDLRFQQAIDEDVLKSVQYGEFDRISWPGAAKDLESVASSAAISIKLHEPPEITIYEHVDCGAYGENNATSVHYKNALALKEKLINVKQDLKINLKIATFAGIKELQSD